MKAMQALASRRAPTALGRLAANIVPRRVSHSGPSRRDRGAFFSQAGIDALLLRLRAIAVWGCR